MLLRKCENGHYYDADKQAECPYCAMVKNGQKESVQRDIVMRDTDISKTNFSEVLELPPDTGLSARRDDLLPSFEDSRTLSYYARKLGVEPVVGWLVAVEGNYFGEDFRLKAGRNFIGRLPEMDVQLGLDLSVSRRRHAIVVYEPKRRVFIAQPGDSSELFYLNDEVVLSPMEMKNGDILTIGETKLMLVCLCGKEFCWEDWA